jgi:hypothetical protein
MDSATPAGKNSWIYFEKVNSIENPRISILPKKHITYLCVRPGSIIQRTSSGICQQTQLSVGKVRCRVIPLNALYQYFINEVSVVLDMFQKL